MMKKKKRLLFLLIIFVGLIPKLTLAETYDGEYSIEYLLRNYNAVALGNKKYNLPPKIFMKSNINDMNQKGSISNFKSIEGAILVNGDCISHSTSYFGSQAGNINSYLKGTKGNNITFNNQLLTNSDYINFDKMYLNIMNQSQSLFNDSDYHINDKKLEISKPGIYTIHKTAANIEADYISNSLLIKNYNKNELYIFNYCDEYIKYLPNIMLMDTGSANSISLKEYIESGKFTGNIIFNFPNAKFINIQVSNYHDNENWGISGNIIAPKALVFIWGNYIKYDNNYSTTYYGSIISNSIIADYWQGSTSTYNIKKANYKLNKKIVEQETSYIEEINDYDDDIYSRNYSISDLLKNYSLVTLNHKQIDSKSKLLELGNNPGSIRLFHITGPILISGDLYGKVHENEVDDFFNTSTNNNYYPYKTFKKFDRIALDLESNEVTDSYINGKYYMDIPTVDNSETYKMSLAIPQPWDNMDNDNINYYNHKNNIFLNSQFENNQEIYDIYNMYIEYGLPIDNYINFDRLYDNIVAEQSAIDEGKEVKNGEDKVTHIPIGGNYVIEDINDINEIVFDNFDEEKDKLTIITVKNEGDINFPLISKDTGSYKGIVTNDYYGKTKATHLYEQDTFVQDSYHGNIVWNIPNATYIKLKENAPFAGHLIAPNADVDTPETHFAGCFIVNSIYGEGNTEAHFYPLTATATYDVPEYDNLTAAEKSRMNAKRLGRLLGKSASTIETTVLGDEAQFRKDEAEFDALLDKEEGKSNNGGGLLTPIIETLQDNPKTISGIGLIIGLLSMIGLSLYTTFKRKKINN